MRPCSYWSAIPHSSSSRMRSTVFLAAMASWCWWPAKQASARLPWSNSSADPSAIKPRSWSARATRCRRLRRSDPCSTSHLILGLNSRSSYDNQVTPGTSSVRSSANCQPVTGRACWSLRTCTGQTMPPSTCCGSFRDEQARRARSCWQPIATMNLVRITRYGLRWAISPAPRTSGA